MDAKKKEHLTLKDKLLFVTQENTKLLKEIASLKGRHMGMLEKIKGATSTNEKRASNDSHATNAASEKAKLKDVASRQEREVELLKLEIQSLRMKRGNLRSSFNTTRITTGHFLTLIRFASFEYFHTGHVSMDSTRLPRLL